MTFCGGRGGPVKQSNSIPTPAVLTEFGLATSAHLALVQVPPLLLAGQMPQLGYARWQHAHSVGNCFS